MSSQVSQVMPLMCSVTVWTLREGKIGRVKLYQSRAEALNALGLAE